MKVKKFNNLWTMGLILTISIIVFLYVIKIIFPQTIIDISHNKRIIEIGVFIDSRKWLSFIINALLSFAILYFVIGACCEKYKLSLKEIIIIVVSMTIVYIIKYYLPELYVISNLSITLILPLIFKGKFFNTVICFVTTNFVQILTLSIRNLNAMIFSPNSATLLVLMIDYYLVIFMLYLLFNYKGGK